MKVSSLCCLWWRHLNKDSKIFNANLHVTRTSENLFSAKSPSTVPENAVTGNSDTVSTSSLDEVFSTEEKCSVEEPGVMGATTSSKNCSMPNHHSVSNVICQRDSLRDHPISDFIVRDPIIDFIVQDSDSDDNNCDTMHRTNAYNCRGGCSADSRISSEDSRRTSVCATIGQISDLLSATTEPLETSSISVYELDGETEPDFLIRNQGQRHTRRRSRFMGCTFSTDTFSIEDTISELEKPPPPRAARRLTLAALFEPLNEVLRRQSVVSDTEAPVDPTGRRPLHTAVRSGSVAMTSELIDQGERINGVTKFDRRSALHLAAMSGDVEMISVLVSHKANIDQEDIYGSTPLQLAAQLGHLSAVRLLLHFNASVDRYDHHGWTALHLAATNGHTAVAQVLVEDANAVVNCQNQSGRTPLHCACAAGHVTIVKILLNYRADVTITDQHDRSALDHVTVVGGDKRKEIQGLIIDFWPTGVPRSRTMVISARRPGSIGQYVNIDNRVNYMTLRSKSCA